MKESNTARKEVLEVSRCMLRGCLPVYSLTFALRNLSAEGKCDVSTEE